MQTAPDDVAVAIIGGGICGIMAGARCIKEGLSFVIFERGNAHGGNWIVRANSYSHLQVMIRGHGETEDHLLLLQMAIFGIWNI